MRVLVIPEDPTLDQYILRPIVEYLFEDLGRRARVDVLENPRLRGVAEALDSTQTMDIVRQYAWMDVFLTLVDRDGKPDREEQARAREREHPNKLFVCLAIEEIEVWMLAAHRDALSEPWSAVRSDPSVKERFAQPFLAQHAPKPDPGPGRGRKWAMRGFGAKWKGIIDVCPELGDLRVRVKCWLAEH